MKLAQLLTGAAALMAALAWFWLSGVSSRTHSLHVQLQALDDSVIAESELHRDVLSARAGMLRNYDPLVREERDLREAVALLRATATDEEVANAAERLASLVTDEEQWVEQFKSNNALLQNSLAYFELFSARLTQRNGALMPKVSTLDSAMLHLTLDTSPAVIADVESQLAGISTERLSATDADLTRGLITHGQMLVRILPATDNALKSLFAAPTGAEQQRIREMIIKRQHANELRSRHTRLVLLGISLTLVILLLHVGAGLRSRALALQQRAALEHMIAGISTRFISARPHEVAAVAERALEELAHVVHADRAYFHWSPRAAGRAALTFHWCVEGLELPPQWPERATALANRVHAGPSGTKEIRNVSKLPAGEDSNALHAAGVRAWLCVPISGCQYSTGILGFDAVSDEALSSGSELGLLRMAVDAFASAAHGAYLEQERERLQAKLQQARRMEIVGALTSGIAHNFNNIIGAILGYAETAQTQFSSQIRAADSLIEIRRAGERARDLVQQILTFGRRRAVRRTQINVRALIDEAKSLLDATLPKHARVVIHENSPELFVSGESSQLQQVILNLCNNAAQAMDAPGTIEIGISVTKIGRSVEIEPGALPPGSYAVISVTDPGRGMDEATLERIFEPFFTTRLEGNGLGLATVREIVLEHSGIIHVRSAPQAGARFDVWLPSVTSRPESPRCDTPAAEVRGNGETVLVLEADRTRLLRHEELLAALGYEPAGFTQPSEAQAACVSEPTRFDAALLSTHLHGMTSALEHAAMLQASIPRLPVILATPSGGEWNVPALAEASIAEIIHQPLSSVELASALARCVRTLGTEARTLHSAA